MDLALDGRVQRLRLILVDTPEVFGGTECYGRAATDFTRTVLPAETHVFLERDVSETDAFGRLLRYVWLEDGRLFNELIVAEGYATLATYPPDVKYVDRIRAAQQAAYEGGRGLWGACPEESPPPAADVYYANCAAARAAGAAPLLRGEPGYRDALDGDKDGVSCE
ncbi:MAG: thermonuclease family protein [Dehalococcoidia bacterium]